MRKINIGTLNQKPIVIMPTSAWEKMRAKFEEMQEDLEMYVSVNYRKSIVRAAFPGVVGMGKIGRHPRCPAPYARIRRTRSHCRRFP